MLWLQRMLASAVIISLIGVTAQLSQCKKNTFDELMRPDYCDEPNQPHLGCNNNEKWHERCGRSKSLMVLTPSLIKFIVREHNVYRNMVAKGTLNKLPAAANMKKMKWDENLAEMARLAVLRCSIYKIQKSFTTVEASQPGYNAVYSKYPKDQDQDQRKIMKSQLKLWFDKYRYVNQQSLKTGKAPGGQDISHFLQMVHDLNDRVGCAAAIFRKGNWRYQLMICIYACNKKKNKYVYRIGRRPTESCKCGSDREFTNLCALDFHLRDCSQIDDDDNKITTTTTRRTTRRPKVCITIFGCLVASIAESIFT